MPSRILAVDWSGNAKKDDQRKKIQLARVENGVPHPPESGRTRQEVCNYLIDGAKKDHNLVVGLDFAFSFPSWFLKEKHIPETVGLWEKSQNEGERWVRTYPFWWSRGSKKPTHPFRKTEKQVKASGKGQPESVFKLVGSKQVGRGSVRGMPHLFQLHEAGFAIWPFDKPQLPMAVEIYPKILQKSQVTKTDPSSRESYIEKHHGHLPEEWRQKTVQNDDAFDAAVSALVMWEYFDELIRLPEVLDPEYRLEGIIWHPKWDQYSD